VAHVGWLPLPSGNRSNRGDVAEAAMYFATDLINIGRLSSPLGVTSASNGASDVDVAKATST
jgi:hypothetical protein